MPTSQHIPECFRRKMEIDKFCECPVVKLEWIRARRHIRRECQVYFLGPAGGGTIGGGAPVALAA